ncbi:PD-(D/E)XK motif protein [Gemmatimonadales bacterium]|nr:PD-(D/E)XK motif protein [Gemmatimonadales bacterium]
MPDLDPLWHRLGEKNKDGTAGWYRIRVPQCPAPLYVGKSVTNDFTGLHLEIATDALDTPALNFVTKGLEITTESISSGRRGKTRVILVLTDAVYEEVFRVLAEDIAQTLSGTKNVREAGLMFFERLKRWHRFLQSHGFKGLSDEACTGLVGELYFLKKLLKLYPDPADALRVWMGPDRESRDFVLARGDVEVKTTLIRHPVEISISSLNQLDTSDGRRLILCHTLVSRNPELGPTLPALVDEVTCLAGDASGLLREKLFRVGYLEAHREKYRNNCYKMIRQNYYEVREAFPKLLGQTVPNGIVRASYSVSVAALSGCEWNDHELAALCAQEAVK